MSDDFFTTIDLNDIPSDLVASEDVRKSGLNIRTLPAGRYEVEVAEMSIRKSPEDAQWNPGRTSINFRLKTEEGRLIFMNASWEAADNASGTDGETALYSQLEQALNLYGAPVKTVVEAAQSASFSVEITETARVEVGALPEEAQGYYLNTKGLGESSMITFYIRAEDADTRMHLAANGAKLKNYVRSLKAN